MKKFLISEEEKNRILGMHQEATKRHYLGEQTSTGVTRPDETEAKPTFTDGSGVAYYIPGLDDTKWSAFVGVNSDFMPFIAFMQKLGIQTSIDNPFKYPKETYEQQYQIFLGKMQQGYTPENAKKEVPIISNLDYVADLINKANEVYLKNWRPNLKGVSVLSNPGFAKNSDVINAKKVITNFDSIYPKILQAQEQKSGLKLT